ncbi:MAG: hypothetical protein IIB85_05120, partial [Chloroflexi bacterium]|nr:hypothetical protein [Chloroflexota bacterium]
SGWTEAACADLTAFAEAHDLPVGTSFRRQDLLDNRHPNYAGHVGIGINPKLAARIEGEIALRSFVQRFPNARLLDERPQYRAQITLRGLENLRVGLK